MKQLIFNKLQARYARFSRPITLEGQDLYTSDTVQNHPLGAMGYADNGSKVFRYTLAGASALVVGNVLQARAQDTQFENMAVTASPIILPQNGPQTVNVTNGSTTIAAGDFVGGSLSVYTTPDAGHEYTILDHSVDASGSAALTVTLDHPLGTAWTTATKVNMKWNPYFKVIQFPATTQTSIPVGVAIYAIPAGQYGWVQTRGIVGVLSDGSTFAVGSEVGTPSGTAGAATVYAAGTTHAKLGTVLQAAASGHWITLSLKID